MAEPVKLQFTAPKRGMPRKHFADLTHQQRVDALAELGLPKFRVNQIAKHYYGRFEADPSTMTDLPEDKRALVAEKLFPVLMDPIRVKETDDGATSKSLWRLNDGTLLESVLMRYPGRVTMCISSQAGCGMNCPFCATGQAGLTRNLSTAEIVEQVVAGARALRHGDLAAAPGEHTHPAGELGAPPEHQDGRHGQPGELAGEGDAREALRVSNVVFMGMGEALANYKAAIGAIRRLVDPAPEGLGMSARGVTMSTVGLVPAIDKLGREGIPVTLALSLHAPDDELRDELVPINTRWKVDEALDAARRYFDTTGRRVSIEYALIRDINDHAWRADLLGEKLNARGRGWVHVNPIPLNPTPGAKWTASRRGVEQQFVERLLAHGIPTTVRDTRGSEIDGACGQLAATV